MSKEVVLLILDCGSSMGEILSGSLSGLDCAKEALRSMMQQKLLWTKQDEVGLVLLGSAVTSNALNEENSSLYRNIEVRRPLGKPDIKILEMIDEIDVQQASGDAIDALLVAMQIIVERVKKLKFSKRIFLFTDGSGPILDDRQAQGKIAEAFKRENIKLNVIGINFTESEEKAEEAAEPSVKAESPAVLARKSSVPPPQRSPTQLANEEILRSLCEEVGGSVFNIHTALDLLTVCRTRAVQQVSKFRGPLEIGAIQIPVFSYGKTAMQNMPALSKVVVDESAPSSSSESFQSSSSVRMDRVYKNRLGDAEVAVPPELLVKSFRYGRQLVPLNEADLAALKYECERALQVLAFVDERQINRFSFLSSVDCIVAEPGNAEAGQALSAFIHAMFETRKLAVVRYVKRKNAQPLLGVLTPEITSSYECLYFNQLPFAEDVREFQFSGFQQNEAWRVNPEQLQAAREFVEALDLMTAFTDEAGQRSEALSPQQTFNPVLQHFYQTVQRRALDPTAELGDLDPRVAKLLRPDEAVVEAAKPAIERLKRLFPLERVESRAGSSAPQHWRDYYGVEIAVDSDLQAVKKARIAGEDEAMRPIGDSAASEPGDFEAQAVESVGAVAPIKDFQALLRRRDDPTIAQRALQQMQERIKEFVLNSYQDSRFPLAVQCLSELRLGCVRCEEFSPFNNFLTEIFSLFTLKKKEKFLQLCKEKEIFPIDKSEVEDSNIDRDEARKFFGGGEAQPVENFKATEEAEDEDLFDALE